MSELAPTYGVSLACELLDLPRSSFYYQVDEPDEDDCKAAIQEIAGEWPRYGYRRIAVQLRRDKQLVVNGKRVRRLTLAPALQVQVWPKWASKVSRHGENDAQPTASMAFPGIRTRCWASKSSVRSRFRSRISPTSACAMTSFTWQW